MAEDMFSAYSHGHPPAPYKWLLFERQRTDSTLLKTNVQYICRFVPLVALLRR